MKNFRRRVATACEAGDKTLLLLSLEQEGSVISESDKSEALNQSNTDGLTLLQSAAQRCYKELVW